ncbi:MAG: arylsulfatase [Verrucomicrobiota bacterium]
MMKFLLCLFCVTGLAVFSQAADSQPNIILILADDMGVGEVSHNGGLIPTPALDKMAKEGMRFSDAHTSSSVCTPTRYGILTGRYNWRSRLKSGVLTKVDSAALMDPNRLNLGDYLQGQGYHTACVGKWHLGADWVALPKDQVKEPPLTEAEKERPNTFNSWLVDYSKPVKNGPIDVGFDQAFYILSSLDMPPYLYLRDDRALEIPTVNQSYPHNEYNGYFRVGAGSENFQASQCLTDFAGESRKYIKERSADNSGKPFFLYLALNSPHTPVVPGDKFKGKYPQYSWYADFVAETDWVVGEVLAQLAESGVDDNTVVIFTADNGFAPYVEIPKMLEAGYQPSGDLRGAKATIYEGGHRVPFLVRWPATVKAGQVCDTTICTTDFFATFADMTSDGGASKLPDTAAEDSFSFYPCLKGENDEVRPYTIHHDIGGRFAIRKGPWKLILSAQTKSNWGNAGARPINTPAKLVQLYHLGDDPSETKNLEETHPEKIQELVEDLGKAFREGRTTEGKPQTNEGWPFRDKKLLKEFPQLAESYGE